MLNYCCEILCCIWSSCVILQAYVLYVVRCRDVYKIASRCPCGHTSQCLSCKLRYWQSAISPIGLGFQSLSESMYTLLINESFLRYAVEAFCKKVIFITYLQLFTSYIYIYIYS